jgi:hypothetical protein
MKHRVQLLITSNAFCIVQGTRAQSKTGMFRDYGVAEAPSGFQASINQFAPHFICRPLYAPHFFL